MRWSDAADIGSPGFGLLDELERRGLDVAADEYFRVPATEHRTRPRSDADAQIHLATGGYVDIWRAVPDAVEVASYDPRTDEQRAEYEDVRAGFIERLEDEGLAELVPLVDTNLFGMSIDTRLSAADQARPGPPDRVRPADGGLRRPAAVRRRPDGAVTTAAAATVQPPRRAVAAPPPPWVIVAGSRQPSSCSPPSAVWPRVPTDRRQRVDRAARPGTSSRPTGRCSARGRRPRSPRGSTSTTRGRCCSTTSRSRAPARRSIRLAFGGGRAQHRCVVGQRARGPACRWCGDRAGHRRRRGRPHVDDGQRAAVRHVAAEHPRAAVLLLPRPDVGSVVRARRGPAVGGARRVALRAGPPQLPVPRAGPAHRCG